MKVKYFKYTQSAYNFGYTSIKSHFESYFSPKFITKNSPEIFPGDFGAKTLAYPTDGGGSSPKTGHALRKSHSVTPPPGEGRTGVKKRYVGDAMV